MTEKKYTILCTGSAGKENGLREKRLVPPAITVDERPFIRVDLNSDEHTRYQVQALARRERVVVFTSTHAVHAVRALLPARPDWRIYCTEGVTRQQAAAFFGEAAIAGVGPNAEDLAAAMIRDGIGEAIFFCGDQRRDLLPAALRKQGVALEEHIVYRTQSTPVRLEKPFDAILFFSPSAVASFFSVNSLSPLTRVYALGSTTADSLRRHTNQEIILSPQPDKEFLLQMAIADGQSQQTT